MIKFILGAWVLLFSIVASTQVFDFWRIDGSDASQAPSSAKDHIVVTPRIGPACSISTAMPIEC